MPRHVGILEAELRNQGVQPSPSYAPDKAKRHGKGRRVSATMLADHVSEVVKRDQRQRDRLGNAGAVYGGR